MFYGMILRMSHDTQVVNIARVFRFAVSLEIVPHSPHWPVFVRNVRLSLAGQGFRCVV